MNFEPHKIIKYKKVGKNEIILYALSDTMWVLLLLFDEKIIRSRNYVFGETAKVIRLAKKKANLDFNLLLNERWKNKADLEDMQ